MNIKVVPNPDQKGWEENGTTTDGTPIYKWEAGGVSGNGSSTGAGMVISPTPPTEKVTGMQWLNSTTAEVFIWDEDKWVEMPAGSGGSSGGAGGLWTDNGDTSISYTAGSVGIGTDTPLRKLHISEDSGSAFLQVTTKDDSSSGGILMGSSSNPTVGQVFYEHASDSMRLVTSNEERMTIDADGDVGIGTGSPASVVTSASTCLVVSAKGSNSASTSFQTENAQWEIGSWENVGGVFGVFNNATTSFPLTIAGGGNVGIGTSTPTIYGSGYGILTVNGSTAGLISFQNNDVAVAEQYYDSATNQLRFQTNTDDGGIAFRPGPTGQGAAMTIDADGDVTLAHPAGLYGRRASGDLALKLIGYVPGTDDVELVTSNQWLLNNGSGDTLLKANATTGRVDIPGSLYVNGTPKIGTVDLIKAFSKLRDAVKDEETVESLKESITNCIGGLIEEWEAMQSTATQEAGE